MIISPSLISSRLERLKEDIQESVKGGAEQFHLDIMDGHFVPNLTMGPDLIKAIRRCTDLPLEAHMMITDPLKYWKKFSEAGADIMLFHYESPAPLKKCFADVKGEGKEYGIVINPETAFSEVKDLLCGASMLVIMSVHPGFSGQSFIEGSLAKVREARQFIDENGLNVKIEVDGGINNKTAGPAAREGAHILVSASYIFGGEIADRIKELKTISSVDFK